MGLGGDPWRRGKSGIEVRARVVPRSSKDQVEGIDETPQGPALRVRVRAVPDKGQANRSVEKTVADWLGVPRTSVAITAGTTSRVKLVAIAGKPDFVEAVIRDRVAELKPS
ncbi:MAG: hypothetical protein HC869_02820 [Rhodospirillales bacterium]|nr:hypothetical protein [Rhodospirillales bacterium]